MRIPVNNNKGFNQLNNFVKDKMNVKRYSTGFTMIELIITILILSFGIMMVYNVFSGFVLLTNSISPRLTAVYLAQEGMEIVRNIRDENFIDGKSWKTNLPSACSTGCQADYKTGTPSETNADEFKTYNSTDYLNINTDGLYGYAKGTVTVFRRKIIIKTIDTSTVDVTVDVYWTYNRKSYTFTAEGYLYDWYRN